MKNIKQIKIISPKTVHELRLKTPSKFAAEIWAETKTFYNSPIFYGHNSSNKSVIEFIGNKTKTTSTPIAFAIKGLRFDDDLIYSGENIRELKIEEYAKNILEDENTLTSIGTRLFQSHETLYLFKSISFEYNEKKISFSNVTISINTVKIDFSQHI